MRTILGISAFYHDAAATLVREGQIVAAAQEERFTRRKNDERFPCRAVEFCLNQARLRSDELDAVAFYDKPITKFTRVLETYLAIAPRGLLTFPRVLPSWLSEKLNLPRTIREEVPGLAKSCPIFFTEHHQAHAASAFYPGPFAEAAILTVDGVGEWATTTIGLGRGDEIRMLKEIRFPHSLGLLYSAFTSYCGFRINSGEYKLMGLAPYGEPKYAAAIRDHLIDLKADGSFWLNLDYFNFLYGWTMTNDRFHGLFGGPPRTPESPVESRHMDVARSIQEVTEEIMLRLARHTREVTNLRHLCMAGGVALNCVANGRILREKIFDQIWIQPAAGDAGGSLGAALAVWHQHQRRNPRTEIAGTGSLDQPGSRSDGSGGKTGAASSAGQRDKMQGSLLGPEFSDAEIEAVLRSHQAVYERLEDDALLHRAVELLKDGHVVGWVQGRMEFGPRALGNRSILGDARSPKMQSVLNLKVKFRESFRPFAPAVLRERVSDYFELDTESPYMLIVAPVRESLRLAVSEGARGLERLKQLRSTVPAVTHVDFSARVQTVSREDNPKFYDLLRRFDQATGCGVLVNTSFNVRGEPIICTPDDAYRCFINTAMDYLAIGSFVLARSAQPHQQLERTHDPVPD